MDVFMSSNPNTFNGVHIIFCFFKILSEKDAHLPTLHEHAKLLRPCTENANIVNTWRIRKAGIAKLRTRGLPVFTIRVYSADTLFNKPVH
jgi:hypothetical protein